MPYSIEIDLHGHTVDSARALITNTLKTLPCDVREVEFIHGYRGGTALRDMVSRYSNSKIERKIFGLNRGVTIFVIRRQ